MGRLVHTGLGSSSLVAHVLHFPPNANIFLVGTAVINTHTPRDYKKSFLSQLANNMCVMGRLTSPQRPRLVVSRSTCPPLSPSPHANSFILGTAVINTHPHKLADHDNGSKEEGRYDSPNASDKDDVYESTTIAGQTVVHSGQIVRQAESRIGHHENSDTIAAHRP